MSKKKKKNVGPQQLKDADDPFENKIDEANVTL